MHALLIFKANRRSFNPDGVIRTINSMDGIRPSTSSDLVGALFECHYAPTDDVDDVLVRIGQSAVSVALEGPEEAALAFALAFQAKFPEPLSLIDSGYTFEVGLKECLSVDQLRKVIASGGESKAVH